MMAVSSREVKNVSSKRDERGEGLLILTPIWAGDNPVPTERGQHIVSACT